MKHSTPSSGETRVQQQGDGNNGGETEETPPGETTDPQPAPEDPDSGPGMS
jgi:hypothetical protein